MTTLHKIPYQWTSAAFVDLLAKPLKSFLSVDFNLCINRKVLYQLEIGNLCQFFDWMLSQESEHQYLYPCTCVDITAHYWRSKVSEVCSSLHASSFLKSWSSSWVLFVFITHSLWSAAKVWPQPWYMTSLCITHSVLWFKLSDQRATPVHVTKKVPQNARPSFCTGKWVWAATRLWTDVMD